MFKKFLLIIGLFIIFNQSIQTFAEIIPLKKPDTKYKGKRKETACRCLKTFAKTIN